MSVHNALNIGTQAINEQVHANLAGDVSFAFQAVAIVVHDDQVGWFHPALAHVGGSDEEAVFVKADREIPVGGGDKTAAMQQTSKLDDRKTMLSLARHRPPSPGAMVQQVR